MGGKILKFADERYAEAEERHAEEMREVQERYAEAEERHAKEMREANARIARELSQRGIDQSIIDEVIWRRLEGRARQRTLCAGLIPSRPEQCIGTLGGWREVAV